MRIKFLIIGLVAIFFSQSFVFAEEGDFSAGSYIFYLYYNSANQLVSDRNSPFAYDVVTTPFTQPQAGQFPYHGEVINFVGEVAAQFDFNVQPGAIAVSAPYVSDGSKAIFYNAQRQPVLTISVAESSFCNDDGICNADRGEDSLSCSRDCQDSLPAAPANENDNNPSSSGPSSGIISGIIYSAIGIFLLGLLWWIVKRRRANSAGELPTPPTLGSASP